MKHSRRSGQGLGLGRAVALPWCFQAKWGQQCVLCFVYHVRCSCDQLWPVLTGGRGGWLFSGESLSQVSDSYVYV